jgi:chromosome segregation ATPase
MEPDITLTPLTPEPPEPRNLGGRPRKPSAPRTAGEVRHLLAVEAVKEKPHAARQRILQQLLESFEKQEENIPVASQLAQSQAEKDILQGDINSLRQSLAASQSRCESLSVPHDEFEDAKAERDSLRREITSCTGEIARANSALQEARDARDIALSAQRAAEQGEKQARGHLNSQYMKLIEPLEVALRRWSGSHIDARIQRHHVDCLMEEFRRMHAQALAAMEPVPQEKQIPTSTLRQATPKQLKELAKARADQIEAARVDNLNQPRSIEPGDVEHLRERFVPRAPEPEPQRPISGGVDWEPWV